MKAPVDGSALDELRPKEILLLINLKMPLPDEVEGQQQQQPIVMHEDQKVDDKEEVKEAIGE